MRRPPTTHSVGWRGFRHLYFHLCYRQFRKSLLWAFVSMACVVACAAFLSTKNSYELITAVTELGLRVTPPLLGFTLSSFALVVGFKDDTLMTKLKSHRTKAGITMYQQLVVTFIAMLASVFLCLLLCVLSKLFLSLEITAKIEIYKCICWINVLWLIILTFSLFYALYAVKDLLSNLFSLGQTSNSLFEQNSENMGKINKQ